MPPACRARLEVDAAAEEPTMVRCEKTRSGMCAMREGRYRCVRVCRTEMQRCVMVVWSKREGVGLASITRSKR